MTIVQSLPGSYNRIDRLNLAHGLKTDVQRLEALYAVLRSSLLDYRRNHERYAADIVAIISDMSFIKELADTETRRRAAAATAREAIT